MPTSGTLAVFSVAALALLVVPGPAVLYIVTRSIHQGTAAGLVSMLGIQAGGLVHVAAAAVGLSALLVSSAAAFTVVKYLGAAYLVFLGLRTLFGRRRTREGEPVPREPLRRLFMRGVVVNLLNPKTALFFFSFLPQFVDPARGSAAVQTLVLGLLFIGLAVISDGTYALLAARLGSWLKMRPSFERRQQLFAGGVYISLGVLAAVSGAKPRAA